MGCQCLNSADSNTSAHSNIGHSYCQSYNADVWTCWCLTHPFKHWHFKHQQPNFKLRTPKVAEGCRGEFFSGCQRAKEYVRLYAPKIKLDSNLALFFECLIFVLAGINLRSAGCEGGLWNYASHCTWHIVVVGAHLGQGASQLLVWIHLSEVITILYQIPKKIYIFWYILVQSLTSLNQNL